jgi:hypothetical protein
MHYLDAIFCLMQLKQYWNKIMIYKVANFIVTTALILKNQVNGVLYAQNRMLKMGVLKSQFLTTRWPKTFFCARNRFFLGQQPP